MIKRQWNKYLNCQKYSECQLVTALNAYYYLTGKVYCFQDSEKYEELVDLCGARYGAATSIEKVHRKLGLVIKKEFQHKFLFCKNKTLPLEMSVWHKRTGYHSVCIVDYEPKTECFRIPNFKYATSIKGWMFAEDTYLYERESPSKTSPWKYRLFGLKK